MNRYDVSHRDNTPGALMELAKRRAMSLAKTCHVLSLSSFPEMIHNGTQNRSLAVSAAWVPINAD